MDVLSLFKNGRKLFFPVLTPETNLKKWAAVEVTGFRGYTSRLVAANRTGRSEICHLYL